MLKMHNLNTQGSSEVPQGPSPSSEKRGGWRKRPLDMRDHLDSIPVISEGIKAVLSTMFGSHWVNDFERTFAPRGSRVPCMGNLDNDSDAEESYGEVERFVLQMYRSQKFASHFKDLVQKAAASHIASGSHFAIGDVRFLNKISSLDGSTMLVFLEKGIFQDFINTQLKREEEKESEVPQVDIEHDEVEVEPPGQDETRPQQVETTMQTDITEENDDEETESPMETQEDNLAQIRVSSSLIEGAYLSICNIGKAGRLLFDACFNDEEVLSWSIRESKSKECAFKVTFIKTMLAYLQERPNQLFRTMEGYRQRLSRIPEPQLSDSDFRVLKQKVFISYANRRRKRSSAALLMTPTAMAESASSN